MLLRLLMLLGDLGRYTAMTIKGKVDGYIFVVACTATAPARSRSTSTPLSGTGSGRTEAGVRTGKSATY